MAEKQQLIDQVFEMLADGNIHTLNSLSQRLSACPEAITAACRIIEAMGTPIIINMRLGQCQIIGGLSLLDKATLQSHLQPVIQTQITQLLCYKQIDSTQRVLRDHIKTQHPGIIACLAEQQTHGQGRRGRRWISPYGHNLYCTLSYPVTQAIEALHGVTLALSVMVKHALDSFGNTEGLSVKWPNDLYYREKKLAGVLVEVLTIKGKTVLLIGIGINTQTPKDSSLTHPATSTESLFGRAVCRNHLAAAVLTACLNGLSNFTQAGWPAFQAEWETLDQHIGQVVQVKQHEHCLTGTMVGLNAQGALLLQTQGPDLIVIPTGEVSLIPHA